MQLAYRVLNIHLTGIRDTSLHVDEYPAYGASSGGTAGNDTWSGTDNNDAYEKMLKHSH